MKLTLAALLFALPNAVSRPDDDAPSLRANKTAPRELTILKDGRDNQGRILLTKNHRGLGKIDVSSLESAQAGARAFLEGTNDHGRRLGPFENGNGDKFNPKNKNPNHVRFVQEHNGMEIEGASVVVHTNARGDIVGVNGEYVSTSKVRCLCSCISIHILCSSLFLDDYYSFLTSQPLELAQPSKLRSSNHACPNLSTATALNPASR